VFGLTIPPLGRTGQAKTASISIVVIAAAFTAVLAGSAAFAQSAPGGADKSETSPAAQNFRAEHEIGRRFHIDPDHLPAPKTGPIVTDRSLIVPYSGQKLEVPPGFVAAPFAGGLANPRRLLVFANGDVLVAEQAAGYVTLLRDDGTGHAV
jgi:glucose/arabinose dehydrogenase